MIPIKNGDIVIYGTTLTGMTSVTESEDEMTSQNTNVKCDLFPCLDVGSCDPSIGSINNFTPHIYIDLCGCFLILPAVHDLVNLKLVLFTLAFPDVF